MPTRTWESASVGALKLMVKWTIAKFRYREEADNSSSVPCVAGTGGLTVPLSAFCRLGRVALHSAHQTMGTSCNI